MIFKVCQNLAFQGGPGGRGSEGLGACQAYIEVLIFLWFWSKVPVQLLIFLWFWSKVPVKVLIFLRFWSKVPVQLLRFLWFWSKVPVKLLIYFRFWNPIAEVRQLVLREQTA